MIQSPSSEQIAVAGLVLLGGLSLFVLKDGAATIIVGIVSGLLGYIKGASVDAQKGTQNG